MRFRNRDQAGRELAEQLLAWSADHETADPVVIALPRGGVPVAAPIASALHAALDVLVVRKIGLPGRPECGIGAIVGDDPPLFDTEALELFGLSEDRLGPQLARERAELRRREELYRAGRPEPRVVGRTVVLVDDGLATGLTAHVALRHLRRRSPGRLILAVPVGASSSLDRLSSEADDVLCLHQPTDLRSVGEWYDDFDQVTDGEVLALLRGRGEPGRSSAPSER
ncbi:phosphoribosyltransferase [Streptomyces anulatus]|uniref:phosphoribosyltransferase n=1 Tax=Streptomyces anulatus TaxID=1892 RepID=UPI0033FC1978